MGVNSLPKTVTRQRRDCDMNPGPSAPCSRGLAIVSYLTDDGPVYHAPSVHLLTRFDDRYAVAKFSADPELRKKFHKKVGLPLFLEISKFVYNTKHSVGLVEGSSLSRNQLDSFSRFDRTPTWDGQTQTHSHSWYPRAELFVRWVNPCVGLGPL